MTSIIIIALSFLFCMASYLFQRETEETVKLKAKIKQMNDKYYKNIESKGFHPDFINMLKERD